VTRQHMTDLPKGARFIGPDGSEYKVTRPASDHPNGWVEVWDLSISGATRGGVFMTDQVETDVEVLG